MKCGDSEKFKKKSPTKNTKHEQRKQGPLQKLKLGSGTMEELASFADRSHPAVCFQSQLGKRKNQ